jgi:hypothetical protein
MYNMGSLITIILKMNMVRWIGEWNITTGENPTKVQRWKRERRWSPSSHSVTKNLLWAMVNNNY